MLYHVVWIYGKLRAKIFLKILVMLLTLVDMPSFCRASSPTGDLRTGGVVLTNIGIVFYFSKIIDIIPGINR